MSTEVIPRRAYPSDVTEDEWAFLRPYLTLMREDAPQRDHDLREVSNALRWIVRTGAQWRYIPHDFPAWSAVYQQTRRWLADRVLCGPRRVCKRCAYVGKYLPRGHAEI